MRNIVSLEARMTVYQSLFYNTVENVMVYGILSWGNSVRWKKVLFVVDFSFK